MLGIPRLGLLAAATMLAGGAACTDPSSGSIFDPSDPALRARCEAAVPSGSELSAPVAFQLHTHAHSNHGSSSRPASMQFDSHQAWRYGIGGIVWSEHIHGYHQHDSVVVVPASGVVHPDSLHVLGLIGDVTRMGAVREGAGSLSATITDGAVTASATGGTASQPARLRHTTQHIWIDGVARWPETLRFNRPVSSGAKLDVTYRSCGADQGPLHIVVRLSWHVEPNGAERQHALHYVLTSDDVPDVRTIEAPGVVRVERSVPHAGRQTLDLFADASLLPDGDDNTIVDVSWYVESTDGATRCATVERIALYSTSPAMDDNWGESVRLSERYRQQFGTMQFVGFEGWVVNSALAKAGFQEGGRAGAHMNVLFPKEAPPSLPPFLELGGRELVRAVHSNCGVAALNHPFGYDLLRGDSTSQVAVRQRIFDFLLAQRAFGADLIEIGLPARGDGLDVHLRLWDQLSAAGIRVCGIGTSDTHGWRWDNPATASWTENRNPYVTWLWLRGSDQLSLVSALRRCRAYFGNPFAFSGRLDHELEPGGERMGSTVRVTADSTEMRLHVTGVAPNRLWLVQGRVAPGPTVRYVQRRELPDGTTSVWLPTRHASFVRLEVRTVEGTAVAFSNPTWMTR